MASFSEDGVGSERWQDFAASGSLVGTLFGSKNAREAARKQEQQAYQVADFQKYMDDVFRAEAEPTRAFRNESLDLYKQIINGDQAQFRKGPEYTQTREAARSVLPESGNFANALSERADRIAEGEFGNYFGRVATGADISSRGLNSTNRLLQANTNARSALLQQAGNNAAGGLVAQANANQQGATGIASLVGSLFSDERIKSDKKKVGKMNDGTPIYTYKDNMDGKHKMGVMAQEAEKSNPKAVNRDPLTRLLMVNYGKL